MPDLIVDISEPAVTQMKHALRANLPTVMNGHRIEALARGLGFNSYAALRHQGEKRGYALWDGKDARFSAFLAERAYSVPSDSLHPIIEPHIARRSPPAA
ncbi:hypothetical protein [Bosea sp. Root381]|uniref:hypothetical protein n=1 Tax=Bosea sp. Root381 TaxID=1736524 RepID=UPI0012E387CD|nr:hypothetical protein [Bosea sp. Root381]